MGEKHPDEDSVDGDKECMESVAPVSEGTVASGQGGRMIIAEEPYDKRGVSIDVGKEAWDSRFRGITPPPELS